jgi:hypothetical protein
VRPAGRGLKTPGLEPSSVKCSYRLRAAMLLLYRLGKYGIFFKYLSQRRYWQHLHFKKKNHKIVPTTNLANYECVKQKLKIGKQKLTLVKKD